MKQIVDDMIEGTYCSWCDLCWEEGTELNLDLQKSNYSTI
jgi:hypothetical protein